MEERKGIVNYFEALKHFEKMSAMIRSMRLLPFLCVITAYTVFVNNFILRFGLSAVIAYLLLKIVNILQGVTRRNKRWSLLEKIECHFVDGYIKRVVEDPPSGLCTLDIVTDAGDEIVELTDIMSNTFYFGARCNVMVVSDEESPMTVNRFKVFTQRMFVAKYF